VDYAVPLASELCLDLLPDSPSKGSYRFPVHLSEDPVNDEFRVGGYLGGTLGVAALREQLGAVEIPLTVKH
jgi:hypothetical protein